MWVIPILRIVFPVVRLFVTVGSGRLAKPDGIRKLMEAVGI